MRGCWYFVLAQLCTTFPTLLAINLTHSDGQLTSDDLARASLSSLIVTDYGRSLLWLQVLFLYWIALSWFAVLVWVGVGILRHRRAYLGEVLKQRTTWADEPRAGWRFRTVIVQNVPNDLGLRTEQGLIDYFERGLELAPQGDEEAELPLQPITEKMSRTNTRSGTISQVVIIRRAAELQARYKKREEALHELESAHTQLAKNVLDAVSRHLRTKQQRKLEDIEQDAALDTLVAALEPYLDRSVAAHDKSVWEVLAGLPRDMLDPYQPMYRLKRFRGQSVPAIDYWKVKFEVLDGFVRDLRDKAETIAPAATAFVTFRLASDARRACRHMPVHPTRLFAAKTRMAPDARDIIWEKLVRVSFRSDVLRSVATHTLLWFVTLIWTIPIGAFVALISLDNIAQTVPSLAGWLLKHKTAASILRTLIPTLATSIISFFVPTIFNQITMRAQHLFTVSKLFQRVGQRYYTWLIINIVIVFVVGSTIIKSVFTDFVGAFNPGTLLQRIAAAFPAGAPYFVSWQLLTLGLQNGFEIMLFGYAWIGLRATAKATSPRKRYENSLPRILNAYWWQPQTLLAVSIFLIFSLLNSLVIAFAIPYFSMSLLVLKNQFKSVYFRRHFEQNGRMFSRFLRFSIDSLLLACIVFIAFFFINSQGRYGAAAIVLLVFSAIFKLTATRWFAAHMEALDVTEADLFSGAPLHAADDIVTISIVPAFMQKLPLLRKLVLRVPAILLAPAAALEQKPTTPKLPVLERLRRGGSMQNRSKTSIDAETRPMMQQMSALSVASEQAATESSADSVSPEPIEAQPLVQPHPHLVRDDWPDHTRSYEDPFFVTPLEEYLWLPRDPLSPLDLNDTIEYRGLALVSTAGGDGQLWQRTTQSDATGGKVALPEALPLSLEEATHDKPQVEQSAPLQTKKMESLSPTGAEALPSPASANSGRRSVSSADSSRILTAPNVGSQADRRPSWSSALRPPVITTPRSRASSDGALSPSSAERQASDSYFPPPQRRASSGLRRATSPHSARPLSMTTVAQADALREEVLAEEKEEAAQLAKEEHAEREEEVKEERKAATRDSKRFFSTGDGKSKSWLRRWANVTEAS